MKITNELNLPTPFVKAVERDYEYKDKRYSVTSILKGVRETLLTRRHHDKIEQDVSDMIWLILGNAVHSILENSEEESHQLKETKVYIELPNGYVLSGQQDLYDEKLKRIIDYKTGTVWKIIYNDWEDYRMQTMIYCWIFSKLGFEANNADIVMILKDHSKTKAKIDKSYPQHPVYIKHFDFTEKDFEDIEKFLIEKFEEIEHFEKVADDDLPICTEEERWADPTVYAVMKEGRQKAVKLHKTEEEANKHLKELDSKHYIEVRQAEDKKCVNYCSCNQFCSYYKSRYGDKSC